MADPKKAVPENVVGEFFVDSTCIDCDTCRQLAPEVFGQAEGTSYVRAQPGKGGPERSALRALLACPTGSIGTLAAKETSAVMADFPLAVEGNVFYCGFNSPRSYGGNSYFIRHPQGNWLVDSPKFLPHLVRKFEEAGGLSAIFLTHQDDVADAAKYAERFKARRIIHERDRGAQPGAEILLKGEDVVEPVPGFRIIPTPGHTEGHCVLLLEDRYLFTGDHLWWSRERRRLGASRSVAWYSWKEQAASMGRLAGYDFEWVLPGHGQRVHLPLAQMRREMGDLVGRMKASLGEGA